VSASHEQTGRPDLCSIICRSLQEPLAGTSIIATGWVLVEQPGPWGHDAITQSHLDPVFGAEFDAEAKKADLRFGLIRSPGKHSDAQPRAHRVYVACTVPGRSWMLSGSIPDPTMLAGLDLEAVRHGDVDGAIASLPELAPVNESILLVCTNGKRDECCAVLGRPIVKAASATAPGRVWEASHLGGHRFAPTATLLPAGITYGHLDGETAAAILAAADRGETVLEKLRGRSTWTKRGQLAEITVRHLIGEAGLDALSVVTEDVETVTVQHVDGRVWTIEVIGETAYPRRPESCGKEPFAMSILRAGTVTPGVAR
jgi:hypothetical protein